MLTPSYPAQLPLEDAPEQMLMLLGAAEACVPHTPLYFLLNNQIWYPVQSTLSATEHGYSSTHK